MNIDDLQAKDYLGDGVYCGFDGWQIWIWTSNGLHNSEPIALESNVLRSLSAYVERISDALEADREKKAEQ